ncbi:gem-associated protein 7 [Protopterus annectens]|uniref:gem-associated protein 7 n=1 Tax=Protopterus annectens TaxID=7888 RepID=UPI001CFAD19C|nr:gem-associated protein 7 [Protopterus annectens]
MHKMRTVPVIRLPRGPDGSSRGFDPNSPRYKALVSLSISASSSDCSAEELAQEQNARAILRERYLHSLLAMVGKQVCFAMYEKVKVAATFRASDIDILNFQVSDLQTPLGIQKDALLRCPDIISYSYVL